MTVMWKTIGQRMMLGLQQAAGACTCAPRPDTTPQPGVETMRFLGRWYEQARYDNLFEHGLEEVCADYEAGVNGAILVTNRGRDAHGREHLVRGRATVPDAAVPGRMLVSFVPPYRWFRSPYHILYTDGATALVSGAGRSFLWLLSRDPHPAPEQLQPLLAEARRRGFSLTPLRPVRQR